MKTTAVSPAAEPLTKQMPLPRKSHKRFWIASAIAVVVVGLAVGLGVYFGIFARLLNSNSSGSSSRTLSIDQIKSTSTPLRRRSFSLYKRATLPQVNSTVASGSSYNYAEILGIKMTVMMVAFTPVDTSRQVSNVDYGEGEEFTFGPGIQSTPIAKSTLIETGSYNRIEVQLKNFYSLKAYCKTLTKFVYTTATAIKAVPLNTVTSSLPADLDYYDYAFAWPAIASSPSSRSQNTERTAMNVYDTFEVTGSSKVNILFETSFSVTCFDGVSTADAISPFNGGPTNAGSPLTNFFPNNAPNFGLLSIPLFGYIGDDADAVVGETYLYSAGGLNSQVNASATGALTIAFKPNGDPLGVQGRNSPSNGQIENEMIAEKAPGSQQYTIYSGAYHAGGKRKIKNRAFTLTRAGNNTFVASVSVGNGEDCGKSIVDQIGGQQHNRAKSCAPSNSTLNLRRAN